MIANLDILFPSIVFLLNFLMGFCFKISLLWNQFDLLLAAQGQWIVGFEPLFIDVLMNMNGNIFANKYKKEENALLFM